MSFQQISIRNFRAIESLDIKNIKQINLLTGRNNCGKTSVLEAIFLLIGMSNPQLAINIHNFRGLTLTDNKDFSYLFNGFDFSKTPAISGKLKSKKRTLVINPIYPTFTGIVEQVPGRNEPAENKPISSTTTKEDVPDGLKFDFRQDEKSLHSEVNIQINDSTHPEFQVGQVNVKYASDYRENLHATFINPASIMNSLHQRLEAILVRKKSDEIIEALREIEPNLRDIKLGTGGKIYADIAGIGRLVPINIMGDGIVKILAILVTILERKDGILLIDEIENGLHYTALVPLWKSIFRMAKDGNVQLFIATHSYECVVAMMKVYRGLDVEERFISLFRIDRDTDNRHSAPQYETDTLLAGIEKAFEVR